MIVYPHRITNFAVGLCDICNQNKATRFLVVKSLPHKGFQYCDDEFCHNEINRCMDQTTISLKTLLERFGPTISIRRSNGEREAGWLIVSEAYKSGLDDDYMVKVANSSQTLSKFVTISILEEWNPSHK